MPAFKDSSGREWLVRLSAPLINDVRKELDTDLVSLSDPVFAKLLDFALLVNVLWVLVRKQATAAGITDVQFGESLVGDSLDGASEALVDAVLDFFPPRIRQTMRALAKQDTTTKNAAMDLLNETFSDPMKQAAMMANQKQNLQRLLDRLMPSNGATVSPDSLDALPTTGPLPNSG